MRLHGAAAMAGLLTLGALLTSHVLPSWRRGRNRASGVVLATAAAALVVSGYLLYYSGSETGRAVASWAHVGLGLLLPAAFALHARAAWRARRNPPPRADRRRPNVS